MIGSQIPQFPKKRITYWPYWFTGRPIADRPRLWPWVMVGLIVAGCVRYVLA
jgi:hypothetical protein